MDEDVKAYMERLETGFQDANSKNVQLNQALATSTYQQENNAIEYQLETQELLDQIQHDLRCDYIKIDSQGNEYWANQEEEKLKVFNEYGVNLIMSKIRKYITKHTVLSNYDETRINEILADLGDDLRIAVFVNYEKMGMDTEFKKSQYPGIVIGILHMIESSYRRALRGKTSEDINSAKIFTQSDITGGRYNQPIPVKKKFNLFKPNTW